MTSATMTEVSRALLCDRANEAARLSRRGGAPILSVASDPETIARWLQWNDPNGSHTAELAAADGCDPYDASRAWAELASQLTDE